MISFDDAHTQHSLKLIVAFICAHKRSDPINTYILYIQLRLIYKSNLMWNCFSIERGRERERAKVKNGILSIHLQLRFFSSLSMLIRVFFSFRCRYFRFSLSFLFFDMFWYSNDIYCFHRLRSSASWLNVEHWINISIDADNSVYASIPLCHQNAHKITNTKKHIRIEVRSRHIQHRNSTAHWRLNAFAVIMEWKMDRKNCLPSHSHKRLCASVTFWSSESLRSILNGP